MKQAERGNIKMLALDLDNTTLDRDSRLSEANRESLKEIIKRGVHVVIATGRSFSSLPDDMLFLEGLEYIITSNGGEIRNLREGEVIYRSCIDPDVIETVHEIFTENPHMLEVFVKGHAYIGRKEYEDIMNGSYSYRDKLYVLNTRNPVDNIMKFMLDKKNDIENINVFFEENEKRTGMRRILRNIRNANITSSLPQNLEIGGESTSKGDALSFLSGHLGIDREEVIACGDSPNDESMLRFAGLGIAVANAEPELKAVADVITVSNEEDAVAKIIKEYIL